MDSLQEARIKRYLRLIFLETQLCYLKVMNLQLTVSLNPQQMSWLVDHGMVRSYIYIYNFISGTAKIWDVETGKCKMTLPGHSYATSVLSM
jgi:hypothetical protein